MKKLTVFLWLVVMTNGLLFAQVGINDDGSSPSPSAGLDVKFTNKGFLLPRMSMTQRNEIANPSDGLMVFCTDCGATGSLSVFSSGTWRTFLLCSCAAPEAGIHTIKPGQITWSWNAVPDAIGYRWHTVNDYSAATEMGSSLVITETGILCDTSYLRYVWAYNFCAVSLPLVLNETIPAAAPAAPFAGPHIALKTQITWNWTTVAGATGYKWSQVNNFLTATDMGMTNSMTEDSLVCQTSYTRYAWAYNGCGYSVPVTLTRSTLSCITCGDPVTVNHSYLGGVAPVNKTVIYGTVNGVPGELSKCWITSNLGSDHQATAVNDNTEPSAGWYWQFNLKQGYKFEGSTRTPGTSWNGLINENSNWQAANDPCSLEMGTGWRVPTYTEWNNVFTSGGWTNWNGPWSSALKLHAAGHLDYNDGVLYNRGIDGYYWSSIQNDLISAYSLGFWITYCGMYSSSRKSSGFSIRCIAD